MCLKNEIESGFTKTIELGYAYHKNNPSVIVDENKLRPFFHKLCLDPKRIKKSSSKKNLIYKDIFVCYYLFNIINDKLDYVSSNLADNEQLSSNINDLKSYLFTLFLTIDSLENYIIENIDNTYEHHGFNIKDFFNAFSVFVYNYSYYFEKAVYSYSFIRPKYFYKDRIRDDLKSLKTHINLCKFLFPLQTVLISSQFNLKQKKFAKLLLKAMYPFITNSRIVDLVIQKRRINSSIKYNTRKHFDGTTQIQGVITKKNEDTYQFRIDFPHRGENGIHINLEETKNEELIFTGYPVSIEELSDIKISEESLFKIFFRLDGFYWFKVNPKNNISQISENQIEKNKLNDLLIKHQHHKIISHLQEKSFYSFINSFCITLYFVSLEEIKEQNFEKEDNINIRKIQQLRKKRYEKEIDMILFAREQGDSFDKIRKYGVFRDEIIDAIEESENETHQ